jgi:hypothetical protein
LCSRFQMLFSHNKTARLNIALIGLAIITFFLFTSCGPSEPRLVRVVANHAPLALLVEEYNRLHRENFVFFSQHQNPGELLQNDGANADLLIGPHLYLPRVLASFPSLNFPESVTSPEKEALMSLGLSAGQHRILPLSQNPLIVVFKKDGRYEVGRRQIEIQELREISRSFNRYSDGHLVRMGFDPFWNTQELPAFFQALGGDFTLIGTTFQTNDQGFQSALSDLRQWVEENGGNAGSRRFREKYFLGNPYSLLNEGRIGAYLTAREEFYALPEEIKNQLSYRYLTQNGKGFLSRSLIFAGLTGRGKESAAAQDFLNWLLSGRFSAQQHNLSNPQSSELNELTNPSYTSGVPFRYGANQKKISLEEENPDDMEMKFFLPSPSSPLWPRFYNSVFLPWLNELLSGQSNLPLELVFQEWLAVHEVQE